VLKKAAITLSVDVPEGLLIDGYPGSYGQILTNLFLNAANHASPTAVPGPSRFRHGPAAAMMSRSFLPTMGPE